MKLIIFVFIILVLSFCSIGQSSLTENQVAEYTKLSTELEGTYQIQMIDTRSLPTITLDIYPLIKNNRKDDEVTFLVLSDNLRIKILPKNLIESNSFEGVGRIVYINSSEL